MVSSLISSRSIRRRCWLAPAPVACPQSPSRKNAGHRGKIPERARRHRNKRKPKGSAIGCGRDDRKAGGKAAAAIAGDLLDLRLARGLVGEREFFQVRKIDAADLLRL